VSSGLTGYDFLLIEVARLKILLYENHIGSSSPQSSHMTPPTTTASLHTRQTSETGGIALPQLTLLNIIAPDSPETRFRSKSGSPDVQTAGGKSNSDPFMDLLFSGWNPDLPEPATLNH
jgi:hypothetical protein